LRLNKRLLKKGLIIMATPRQIMNQINANAHNAAIFTDAIGQDNGVKARSCCFCFTRLWAWWNGVSYDKSDVISAINNAFQTAVLNSLDRKALQTFRQNLINLNDRFTRGRWIDNDLQRTIDKIDRYLNPPIIGHAVSSRDRPSLVSSKKQKTPLLPKKPQLSTIDHNMNMLEHIPKPLHEYLRNKCDWLNRGESQPLGYYLTDVRLTKKQLPDIQRKAQKLANEQMIMTIAAEEGHPFVEMTQNYYGQKKATSMVSEWVTDVFEDILRSVQDSLDQPLDEQQLRQRFQQSIQEKICFFNLKQLDKKIPDWTDLKNGGDQEAQWLPGLDLSAKIGQFMSLLPFSQTVIAHINTKMEAFSQKYAEVQAKRKQEEAVSSLERTLKKKSPREILGLGKQVLTQSMVKKAYHTLALRHHPDKHSGESELQQKLAAARFKRANEAFHELYHKL
jgi:hypothetical protein